MQYSIVSLRWLGHLSGVIRGVLLLGVDEGQPSKGECSIMHFFSLSTNDGVGVLSYTIAHSRTSNLALPLSH